MYCLLSFDAVAVSLIKPCIKIVNTVVYNILSSVCNDVHNYESLEGPLLKKENIFYIVITRKLTRNNEITNSL